MKVVFFALILAVFLTQAAALECYICEDCSFSGSLAFLETKASCSSFIFEPRCFKSVAADGTVSRGCSESASCTADHLLNKCDSPSETSCTICCDTDACNSAFNIKAGWLAVALALAAAFFAARF